MDSFTATEWVNLAMTPGTRRNRAEALSQFCKANGFDDSISGRVELDYSTDSELGQKH